MSLQPGATASCEGLRRQRCAIISRYARPDDATGLFQVLVTLVFYSIAWWLAVWCARVAPWLAAGPTLLLALLTLRAFALMHDCGHGSLFRSQWLNRSVGFLMGVMSGMPQFVWAQHHNFHHAHNGDWEKYRGPYTTLSVGEYSSLSRVQRRMYRGKCSVLAAPLAGFIYLIFNPRYTWIKGSAGLVIYMIRQKMRRPDLSLGCHATQYKTPYWKSMREYRHMLWNNLVLLSIWAAMCWAVGPAIFFPVYLVSVSLAGAIGIVLFTVQHNFEHSYASDSRRWDVDAAALSGTSYLVLPRWLNWFTVDIGYHHVHHLSAAIPNYRLAECHADYQGLFGDVRRLRLSDVLGSLSCILWDTGAQRIISLAEYRRDR